MIRYKQTQSKSNQDSIVYASEEFDRPVSSNDVKLYLDQKAFQNATLETNQRYSNGDDNDNNRFPPTTIDLFYKRISDTFRVPSGFRRYNHLKYNKEAEYLFKMTIAHTESRLLYELDSKKIEELKKDLSEKYPWYYKFLHIADKLYYSKQNEAK